MFDIVFSPYGESSFVTALDVINSTDYNLSTTYTIVNKIRPGALLASGNKIRLTVEAPYTANGTISAAYIGNSATTGNAWNFADTPTLITWAGSTSLTLVAGNIYTSDEITFHLDHSLAISIAYNVAASSYERYAANLGSNFIGYSLGGTLEAATVAKSSGYFPYAGYTDFISKLEVAN